MWRYFGQREYELRPAAEGGFPPQHVLALSKAGALFTRLVLDNYHRENITSGDLSEYLDIRLKHVSKVEAMMLNRPVALDQPSPPSLRMSLMASNWSRCSRSLG
jgi:hypothetical protein